MSESGGVSGGRELPAGWAWARLGDLANYVNGRGFKKAEWSTEGRPIIRIQNLTGSGASFNYFADDLEARHVVQRGDLLLSWAATLGVYVWKGPEAALNQHIFKVDPFVDPSFMRYLLEFKLLEIKGRTQGSGMVHVTRGEFEDVRAAIPPLAEQPRIVEALEEQLSRIDSGTATLRQARRRLEGLRKRTLVSTVPDEVPSSWRMTTVEAAGTLDLGRARHPDWHNGPEMRPYLRVANVFEDRIDTTDIMEMDFSGIWERYRLEPGDVLLNEGQSPHLVGRPALYRGIPENVAFTNSLLRFKVAADVLPEWALLVFRRHLHAKRFMREVRITTNIAHLSAKRLKKVEFPVPPLEVQKQLVQRCDELLTGIAAMDQQVETGLRRGKALRAALLRQAFTGGLVSQDPAEEPAAVLLDRIAAERASTAKPKRERKATTKAPSQRAADVAAPEPTSAPALAVQQEFEL
ncbi:restriction endonuclease subunit S [Streptomyces tendae]|uniref:restriction endonuclease subunit S n=1 Tax=Streptomyces tendae TaxID=1932 RepID=UPI00365D8F7A